MTQVLTRNPAVLAGSVISSEVEKWHCARHTNNLV